MQLQAKNLAQLQAKSQARAQKGVCIRGNVSRQPVRRQASVAVKAVEVHAEAAKNFGVFRLSYDVNNVSACQRGRGGDTRGHMGKFWVRDEKVAKGYTSIFRARPTWGGRAFVLPRGHAGTASVPYLDAHCLA